MNGFLVVKAAPVMIRRPGVPFSLFRMVSGILMPIIRSWKLVVFFLLSMYACSLNQS